MRQAIVVSAMAMVVATASVSHANPTTDAASDVRSRVESARKELGAKAPVEVVDGTFVFAAPPGSESALRSSTAFARSVLQALVTDRFRELPKKPVTVVLFFGKASYEKYCKEILGEPCISRFGFFRHDLRAIVMNAAPGLGTLSHELVHPLVDHDFPTAPTWINEGIASLYEAPALPKPGQIRGVKNWRHPRLVTALKSKSERDATRLEKLFGMNDETFRGEREDVNYAMARYACQWLEGQGKLWIFYSRWRDTKTLDPTGERAFAEVMGKSPRDLHDAWAKWVLSL